MSASHKVTFPYQWVIVCLIWLSGAIYFLNYMTVGTLAPFIKPELGLSSTQVGFLCSAVTLGSMVIQIPAGVLCDLFMPGRLISLGLILIGGSAIAISLVHSYIGLFFFLILVGLGVGLNQAPASKAIVTWFSSKGRATAMGIKQTGITMGGVLASIFLPAIALEFNTWRFSFRAAGIASLLSAGLIFLLYKEREPSPATTHSSQRTLFRKDTVFRLVFQRDFMLICLTGILLMIIQFSFSTYFILYSTTVLNFPIYKSGILLALAFSSGAFGRVGWSMLSDYLLQERRKIVLIYIGIIGSIAAASFILLRKYNVTPFMYFFTILFGLSGMGWNAIYLTIVAEFPGIELAGTATGIAFLVSNIGVIVGPPLFGFLVDLTGGYTLSWLLITFCMAMVAVLSQVRGKERMVA